MMAHSKLSRATALWAALVRPVRKLIQDRQGVAATEVGLMMPVIMLLILGGSEAGRYILAHQKTAGLASLTADLVAQADEGEIRESEIADIFDAAPNVVEPYTFAGKGRLVISAIVTDGDGTNRIAWQRCSPLPDAVPDTIAANAISQLGVPGTTNVDLPGDLVLNDGQNAIVAEAYLMWEPLALSDRFAADLLRYTAVFRPRFEDIREVIADTTPNDC